jgi:hypothetical protein
MPLHEYTPQGALELLLRKLADRDPTLAAEIQAAVDQGEDVQETEPRRGRRKERRYRKTVPYDYEEALRIAVDGLRAYFVVQPLVVNSFHENMTRAVDGEPRRFRYRFEEKQHFGIIPETLGVAKPVQLEIRTETQLHTAAGGPLKETQSLDPISIAQIQEQRRSLDRLRELFDFSR